MQLDLKDIKGGELEQGYSCSLSEFPELGTFAADGGVEFCEPLVFQLRFQRVGQLVTVDGTLNATVMLKCGRCLEVFELTLNESFVLTFAPRLENDEVEGEEEVELAVDDLNLIFYRNEVLELKDPLQEQLLMAVPISPVCDVSCCGLCPLCGINLNHDLCDCVRKPFNNKFNILAGVDL